MNISSSAFNKTHSVFQNGNNNTSFSVFNETYRVFQNKFYCVEWELLGKIFQITTLILVDLFVVFQDTIIIKIICFRRKLHSPAHWLVVIMLVLDCIMLIIFTTKMLHAMLNDGFYLHEVKCKLLYFIQRLLRGFQITTYALIGLEKAVFIIVPFRYQILFQTRIPYVIAILTYALTCVLSISCFFEPVRFLPGSLQCSNSLADDMNNTFLWLGVIIRGILVLVCALCLFAISVFAIRFNIKERKRIWMAGNPIQREQLYGMLRNVVITTVLIVSWSIQFILLGFMNASENRDFQGRISAFLYHTFVATINPVMIKLCYKPIKKALRSNKVFPLKLIDSIGPNATLSTNSAELSRKDLSGRGSRITTVC